MDFIDNFTSVKEILDYTESHYNVKQKAILWAFNMYFVNRLFRGNDDDELYKKYILEDITGELHAIAVKWNELHALENNYILPLVDR